MRAAMIDVDLDYPSLSNLAKSQHETLRNLAKTEPTSEHEKLTLATCLNLVSSERLGRQGFHQYLATLDEFVRRILPEPTVSPKRPEEIWVKLIGRRRASAQGADAQAGPFLHALVEATWYLVFSSQGISFDFERLFDRSDRKSKNRSNDADFAVELEGTTFWLDAYSVGFPQMIRKPKETCSIDGYTVRFYPPRRGPADVKGVGKKVEQRVKEKYDDKFRPWVGRGELGNCPVGILLCVFESELEVVGQFLDNPAGVRSIPPSDDLFGDRYPNLEVVFVHTLQADPYSAVLRPVCLWGWTRSSNETSVAKLLSILGV
jgi:hypothetical protein